MTSSDVIMTHLCMTPWSGVEVTQTYEAAFVWIRLYVHRYIRSTLESLRLQVESPVLGTSIAVTFVYLVGWEPSNAYSFYHQGLKTPVEVYLESCPLASVTQDPTHVCTRGGPCGPVRKGERSGGRREKIKTIRLTLR